MKAHIPYLFIIAALLFLLLVDWIPQCSGPVKEPINNPMPVVKNRDSSISAHKETAKKHEGKAGTHKGKVKALKAKRDTSYKKIFDSLDTRDSIEKAFNQAHATVQKDDTIQAEQDTTIAEQDTTISHLKAVISNQDSTNTELQAQNNWLQCELDRLKAELKKEKRMNRKLKRLAAIAIITHLLH